MKKKLFSVLLGIVLSMQGMCSSVFCTTSGDNSIAADDSIVQVEIDMNEDITEIELSEGEQVQLIISDTHDMPEINYVASYSSECKAAVSQDLKLTGYCEGVDHLSIFLGYKDTDYEDQIRIMVNVLPSENISAENRAELERINNLGYGGDDYIRPKMELAGALDKDAPRLDMEKVQEIISSSADILDIYRQFNEYHKYPDMTPYGSSTTRYYYWFDEKGNELVYYVLEDETVNYVKIADDGTVIGVQMLYPEKGEFCEYKDSKFKDYYYTNYNQIKPEGYGTVNITIKDEWSNELLSEDLKDFSIVAYPADGNSSEPAKIIESWNPSESNPHTITGLSKDMTYKVQYTGDKTGEYWYEINTANVYFDFSYSNDELNINIPLKKHYKGEPVPVILGDLNDDGKFNIADVVFFQQWLMGNPDIEIKNWKDADFCRDGELNVFDLCLMKKALIK